MKNISHSINLITPIHPEPKAMEHFTGLCGTCELKDSCAWRTPDTVVFHCEHYI